MNEKEQGIKQAIDHANQVHPDWSELAYQKCLLAITHYKLKYGELSEAMPISIERLRQIIRTHFVELPEPPTKRAWGNITLRLIREKRIEKVGYAPTKSRTAHNAIAAIYKVI
jgi:hypothetical protein